jgi:hypothetical protein
MSSFLPGLWLSLFCSLFRFDMEVIPTVENGDDNVANVTFRSLERQIKNGFRSDGCSIQQCSLRKAMPDCAVKARGCTQRYPLSRQDWERHRDIFTQLYQVEERPLKEVMQIMRDRYNFHAT